MTVSNFPSQTVDRYVHDTSMSVNTPCFNYKVFAFFKSMAVNKWLNETAEVVGDIKSDHTEQIPRWTSVANQEMHFLLTMQWECTLLEMQKCPPSAFP